MRGHIDAPVASSSVAMGPMFVRGWAYSPSRPISKISVFLNGRFLGLAGMRRPRPDVAVALEDPDAELSGFDLHFDLRTFDEVTDLGLLLRVEVSFIDGSSAPLQEIGIQILPSPRSTALDEAPARKGRAAPRPILLHRKIRLLCLERSLGAGGSQLRLLELVQYLQATAQFEITVLSPSDGPQRHNFEKAGASIAIAALSFRDPNVYDQQLGALLEWAKGRFDLALAFTLSGFPLIELAERLKLPSVWRVGEAEPLSTVEHWLGRQLHPSVELRARRAFAKASLIIFTSRAALERHRCDGLGGQAAVLGSGVDVDGARTYSEAVERSRCRQTLGLADCERVLVCAGTVWPVKGQALIIDALSHVNRERDNLRCILIGDQSHEYATAIGRAVERRSLSGAVTMVPYCQDLRPWWRAADVGFSASESESMSTSILEAMAFGLPVLATSVGGAAEIVEDGTTGWLYDANSLDAMIAGFNRLSTVEDETLRSMGALASARVGRNHSRSEALTRMTELLRSLPEGVLPGWSGG